MAILELEQREGTKGITKQLSPAAMGIIFDTLQRDQYAEPERSTIRELVSNGLDAIKEKLEALDIIANKAKPGDFYEHREDEVLADSNWFPEYYDKAWLDPNRNKVVINYFERPNELRDLIEIQDNGVGIGNIKNPLSGVSRLEGVLKLGYSTKRNSKTALGKFGMGAKAGLSTGVSFYIMQTRHNGLEYEFELYDYQVNSIIPRFENGIENEVFYLEEGTEHEYRGYCRKTTELNGTVIRLEVKKHHKNTYINAVKAQLLYFNNVQMLVYNTDGSVLDVPIAAKISYQDELIVVAENSQYSKPHIILNGINYGYVNYPELELQEVSGSVGFKISPSEVTVHPSRERLIWDDKTRAAVMLMQHKVGNIANRLIQEELKSTDIIQWCKNAVSLSRGSGNTLTAVLKGVSGLTAFNPVFEPLGLALGDIDRFFKGYTVTHVSKVNHKSKDGTVKNKLERRQVKTWSEFCFPGEGIPYYLQLEGTKPSVELTLLKHCTAFIKLRKNDTTGLVDPYELFPDSNEGASHTVLGREFFHLQDKVTELIKTSSFVRCIDNITPEKEVEEEVKKEEEEKVKSALTLSARRKLEGKTVVRQPQQLNYGYSAATARKEEESDKKPSNHIPVSQVKAFVFETREVAIADLISTDEKLIVWCYMEEEELMQAILLRLFESQQDLYLSNNEYWCVSKAAAKHMKDCTHINEFIVQIDKTNKKIAMSKELVQYHTARKLHESLHKLRFLANYSMFDSDMHDMYKKVCAYITKYYTLYKGSNFQGIFGGSYEMNQELNSFADKVIELQVYVSENPDKPEGIALMCRTLFGIPAGQDTFVDGLGIEMPMYHKLQTLLTYATPLGSLFNYIEPLLQEGLAIPAELEAEIRQLIQERAKF